MKKLPFFQRSALTATLWGFRREFLIVGLFSMIANVLMLTPTLYMLQVYDRVLTSGSIPTLLVLFGIVVVLYLFLAFYDGLAKRIRIPGIDNVERDTVFDDNKMRSAGIRLH